MGSTISQLDGLIVGMVVGCQLPTIVDRLRVEGGGKKSDRSNEDSPPSVVQTIIDISDDVPTQSSKSM